MRSEQSGDKLGREAVWLTVMGHGPAKDSDLTIGCPYIDQVEMTILASKRQDASVRAPFRTEEAADAR